MSGLLCFCADVHKGKSAASAVIRIDPIVATIMAIGHSERKRRAISS